MMLLAAEDIATSAITSGTGTVISTVAVCIFVYFYFRKQKAEAAVEEAKAHKAEVEADIPAIKQYQELLDVFRDELKDMKRAHSRCNRMSRKQQAEITELQKQNAQQQKHIETIEAELKALKLSVATQKG